MNIHYMRKIQAGAIRCCFRFPVCNQYGKDPRKAIKALTKRVPGYPLEEYRKQFENNLKLFIAITGGQEDVPKSEYENLRKTIYWFYWR